MSKQSVAKESQGYVAKAVPGTCGNCAHYKFDIALPKWMAEQKVDSRGEPFTVDEYGQEKDKRCGIGGFAVKKAGTCLLFEPAAKV